MTWVLLLVIGIAAVELLIRTPLIGHAGQILKTSQKSVKTISSKKISDHWKERAVLQYSKNIFLSTMWLFLYFVIVIACIWGAVELADLVDPGFAAYIFSVQGILIISAVSVVYVIVRKRFASQRLPSRSDYGSLDKLLHRLALGQRFIAEASFDFDQSSGSGSKGASDDGRHVFIAGLARAGTTVLMRRFYETGEFRSLTYRDMPFVLMPRLWKRLSQGSKKHMDRTERAHGDGVLVDFDSPEAFEEVFWRVFDGSAYIHADRLTVHQPDDALLEKFKAYVGAIIDSGDERKTRYLSKNNNNIVRLQAITACFPAATIIVPFRSPLQQAFSLQNQHTRFVDEHKQDAFTRQYMTWLAHHEFGSDHRPFVLADGANSYDPASLNYWLFMWNDVYGWLAEHAPASVIFLSYEDLCSDVDDTWKRLATTAGIDADGGSFEPLAVREVAIGEAVDATLAKAGERTYRRLIERERASLAAAR